MVNSQPDESGSSGVDDEAGDGEGETTPWRDWFDDPNLRATPGAGSPGNTPVGEDLDLHLGWDRFEKFMLTISRDILGLRGVRFRRYGVLGQAQYGIDLAGREPDRRYTVVQCKDYKVFTPADLRAAIGKFTEGKQPFQAYRLIVATSASTEATALAEELARLQDAHPALDLELWGSEQINERLRYRADVVARFWTRETANVFCTGAPLPGVPAPPPDWRTLAERTLIGPLATDDVMPVLREADEKRSDSPEEAARLYGDLASRLDEAGFRGHAIVLRNKQLDALQKADRLDDAADLAARLAAIALTYGDRLEPRKLMVLLERMAAAAESQRTVRSATTRRHARVIGAAVNAILHPLGSPKTLLTALSSTPAELLDYEPLLVTLAAEELFATQPHRLGELEDLVEAAIGQTIRTPVEGGGEDILIRLRLIRAERHASERESLLRLARGHRLPSRHAALISAREARRCCLEGRAEEATECWRDAVHEAIHAGLPEDAADWLYAIRAVNVQFGPLTPEIDEEHRLAQAVRATGTGQLLSRIRPPRAQAMAALVDKKPIEAILSARRWLIDSTVTGSWADETEALDFLADLYRDNGEPDLAATLYQRAGKAKKLVELAAGAGDHLLPTGSFGDAPWWVLHGRATVVAEQADLLEDSAVGALLDDLTDLAARGRAGELIDSPTSALTLRATKAACAIAARGTSLQAATLLDLLAADVRREPGHYRYSDHEHAAATVAIASAHPDLTMCALTRLFDLAHQNVDAARALLVDRKVLEFLAPRSVPTADGHGSPTGAEQAALRARLSELADGGDSLAEAARLDLEPRHPAVRARAEAARDRILGRPEPLPGRVEIGTALVTDSYLLSSLELQDLTACADKLLALADNSREPASTRKDALVGVRNIVVGHQQGSWQGVFLAARSFVLGDYDSSDYDELMGASHPLSSFKVNMGSSSLRAPGLLLAEASATTVADQEWVRDQAVGVLRDGDASEINAAALTLNALPRLITNNLDADLLAAHEHYNVRQLSAVLSTRDPGRYRETLLRLCRDNDFRVRHTLAEAAASSKVSGEATGEVLRLLAQDARHSVRTATRVTQT
ncbi:hypothetical protein ACFRKD_25185 [Streptomyces niveus]|uniref:hypothetical protein n=1 Tax=Streptomyces niveus TaxID=193462 RepID=UPI0036AACF98